MIDAGSGALVDRFPVPFDHSTTRGVAWRAGEIWFDSQASDQIVELDRDGNHIGIVDGAPLDPDGTYSWDVHIEFAGDRLALVLDSRVHLFDVIPVTPP